MTFSFPFSGHNFSPQPHSTSPFKVEVASKRVAPGGKVGVRLTTKDGSEFKGFLIQVSAKVMVSLSCSQL